MELYTPRLLIREFVEVDEADVHEYASDPEVARYMEWGPNTPQETKDFFARRFARNAEQPRVEYEMAIVLRAENKVVGGVGVRMKSAANREGDVGYVLNRRYWGQGIVTEAARAMVEFGFGQLGFHRIYATCDAENPASARVMQKLGMQYEGRKRQDVLVKGRWRDTLLYAILEGDPR